MAGEGGKEPGPPKGSTLNGTLNPKRLRFGSGRGGNTEQRERAPMVRGGVKADQEPPRERARATSPGTP